MLSALWKSFWQIYVSSRDFPCRATKGSAVRTALLNSWLVARTKSPSLWEVTFERMEDGYREYDLVGCHRGDSFSGLIARDVDRRYMLVPTRKGWRPAPWWHQDAVASLVIQGSVSVAGEQECSRIAMDWEKSSTGADGILRVNGEFVYR